MTGAENHNPYGNAGAGYDTTLYPEGDYYNRINNAMQAWYEYFPIREPSASLLATTTAFNAAEGGGPPRVAIGSRDCQSFSHRVENLPTAVSRHKNGSWLKDEKWGSTTSDHVPRHHTSPQGPVSSTRHRSD